MIDDCDAFIKFTNIHDTTAIDLVVVVVVVVGQSLHASTSTTSNTSTGAAGSSSRSKFCIIKVYEAMMESTMIFVRDWNVFSESEIIISWTVPQPPTHFRTDLYTTPPELVRQKQPACTTWLVGTILRLGICLQRWPPQGCSD
jgi:hypothetical protein